LFSAVSCAALSPASCVVASFDEGEGEAAEMAAKTDGPAEKVPRAAAEPTTPPKKSAATITEPKRSRRVLFIRRIISVQPQNELGFWCEF
jgi:hypothetical protein